MQVRVDPEARIRAPVARSEPQPWHGYGEDGSKSARDAGRAEHSAA